MPLVERFEIPPDAAGTLEGLMHAGYTVHSAVADLIDNALAGGATRVDVTLRQEDGDWNLEISDNGRGMTRAALIEAMRLSARPAVPRGELDLGRYGIGMKAAALHLSASGCMAVDTCSGHGDGGYSGWSLEGARAGGWTIEVHPPRRTSRGTTILIPGAVLGGPEASTALSQLWQHLALVFAAPIAAGLELRVQGRAVPAVDVLGMDLDGTRLMGPWLLGEGGRVSVSGAILPVTDPDGAVPVWFPSRERLSGLHLRRGGRAITMGGWTDLARRGHPSSDRVRLLVEIRPEDGDEWSVDLTKSRAVIPPALLPRLRELTDDLVGRARRLRGLRRDAGKRRPEPEFDVPLWRAGRINREHPAVVSALREGGSAVKTLLKVLEAAGNHPEKERL